MRLDSIWKPYKTYDRTDASANCFIDDISKAYGLLNAWKGDDYIHGIGCLDRIGTAASEFGKNALVVSNDTYIESVADEVIRSLEKAGIRIAGGKPARGAKPNAPREDVYRLTTYILQYKPDSIIAIGGGSTIDACKAASMLAALGGAVTPEIDCYFGTGKVTEELRKTGLKMAPVIAVETSASSGAHLTKYSNITDPVAGQKKLIVDNAIVPAKAIFDYRTTCSMPVKVTIDGALDAIAHTFEVFCGAKPEYFELARNLAVTAVSLVAEYAKETIENPDDTKAREAIGLATDLGGYAIMVGGTSGPHLTSFSLVDIVGHGTACGLMNPYYWVFYSKAIQPQLKAIGNIFRRFGYTDKDIDSLSGRELALSVAVAMIEFEKSIGAPYKLEDIPGFKKDVHIARAIKAAKDPDLKMKLQNMPVPMKASDVDEYMLPILDGAASGDLSVIKEM